MSIKQLLFALLLLPVSTTAFTKDAVQWYSVGEGKDYAISGIANLDEEHFLVVHDRKKPFEPRLSLLTWEKDSTPSMTHLNWCDENDFPIDLEAITAIPGYEKQFLLLASRGKVTRIQLDDDNNCKVTAQFKLPTATDKSNMEGLALHCFAKDCVLTWGERGSDKVPGKFSWSLFNVENNQFSQSVTDFEFYVPYPDQHRRSIADIAINAQGQVWISATSDPGDEGPFSSALYHLGTFSQQENQIVWQETKKITPSVRYENDNVKIEGMVFTPTALIMGSESENLGGKIATKPVQELMGTIK